MTPEPNIFVLPGQTLSPANSFIPGHGTHIHAGQICASMAGQVHRARNPEKRNDTKNGKPKAQKAQTASKLKISVLPIGTKLATPEKPSSSSTTVAGSSASSEIIRPLESTSTSTSSVAASPSIAPQAPPRHPDVTSGILARVTRITPRHAQVDILCLSPPTSSSSPSTSTSTSTAVSTPNQANNDSNNDKQHIRPASHDYTPLSPPYPTGLIRAQDIRATPLDAISIPGGSIGNATSSHGGGSSGTSTGNSMRGIILSAFRVGDIVRAKVISMGDQQHYYLSTAADELGVVMAVSAGGGGVEGGAAAAAGGGESEGKIKGGMGSGMVGGGNLMYPVSWREMRDPVTGMTEARKVARPF